MTEQPLEKRDVKRVFFRRPRSCPFSGSRAADIDYKDAVLLRKFVTGRGKIMPRRVTSVSPGKQKELAIAIKRARFLALIFYVAD